ncbi:unnamed protein product, partial [Rotaria magnacalcarata]
MQMDCKDKIDYWEKEISKIDERCDFTGLFKQENKNKVVFNQYEHVKQQQATSLVISESIYRNLKTLCVQNDLNLDATLQFAWHKVLNVYGYSQKTVIGTIVPDIGTFPSILNHNVNHLIVDAVRNIQNNLDNMITQSKIDFSSLEKRKIKHNFFDCLFAYENDATSETSVEWKGNSFGFNPECDIKHLRHPLIVIAYEKIANQCITFVLNYAGELFASDTIDDILATMNGFLTKIGEKNALRNSDLQFLTEKQMNMIHQWNNTAREFPELNTQTTIHKLFEEEAEKSSVKVAVV